MTPWHQSKKGWFERRNRVNNLNLVKVDDMIEYGAVVKIKEKMDWEKAASLFVRSGFAFLPNTHFSCFKGD